MRILLTGADGQVGFELARTLAPLGELRAMGHAALDLENPDALVAACRSQKPRLIVNAAAYTAVDKAESEPDRAHAVNGRAPAILAAEARRLGAVLVHYSTDYVFDGRKRSPYDENDPPAPLGVYGRSKLEGEQAIAASGCRHLVFRTSWVYGPRGRNFLAAMLAMARTHGQVRVVDDQRGAPTTSLFLAQATARALVSIPPPGIASGIYHLSAAGETSWAGFARAIFERAARWPGFRAPGVVPIASSEYPAAARRPRNSVLRNDKFTEAFGFAADSWESQLDACLARMRPP